LIRDAEPQWDWFCSIRRPEGQVEFMGVSEIFVGREPELNRVVRGLGPGTDGLRLSMVSGPSGLGKSTLVKHALARVANDNVRIISVNGRAGTISTPFAPFFEALPTLADVRTTSGGYDVEQLGAELVSSVTTAATKQHLILCFDDVQSLDESSLALLPYVVGVSESSNVSILFIEQSDAIDQPASYRSFIDALLSRRIVDHLALGPMADEPIERLIRATLDLDEAASLPPELILRAQGNPWFAQELAIGWSRGETDVPSNIAAAATSRIWRLDAPQRDLVYAIALCTEGAHINWLERMADQRPREFARTMEILQASGLTREDGDILQISHPLMQQALLSELSAAMRRAIHLELSEVISESPGDEVVRYRAQAFHLREAGRADEATKYYLLAADASEGSGQLHEQFADLVRALHSEQRIEQRLPLLKRCALGAMQLANPDAKMYWTELGRVAAARHDDELYAYALFQQYWTSYDAVDVDRLERAAGLDPMRIGWSAMSAGTLRTLEGDYAAAIEHHERALSLSRASNDRMLEALLLEKLGSAYSYIGRHSESIECLSGSVKIATSERLHSWAVAARLMLSEVLAENLETARAHRECQSAIRYVDDLNLERFRPVVTAFAARSAIRCGQLSTASQLASSADELEQRYRPGQYTASVILCAAETAAELADPVSGTLLVDRALSATDQLGHSSWIFDAKLEQVRLLARTGHMKEAYELASTLSIDEPISTANLALWSARIGWMHENPEFIAIAQNALVGTEPDSPLCQLLLDEAHAILKVAESGDIADLAAVSERWTAVERPLDSLRAQLSIGLRLLRTKDATAIEVLREIQRGFIKCGATYDADFTSGLLRQLGTRSRAKSRTTSVGPLTRRELEIARLVGSGLKNGEVAAQLFLAEKTVAAHLSNIYGKVNVKSRVQLASWLSENDTEAQVAATA
jgi:DNA-binding CsgD family transcriptional regulator/tetratricopeptide (TPR) repeat protein